MNARSVFILFAASALTFAAPANNGSNSDVRQCTSTIATESGHLEAIALMQHLDYRTHQVQLEILRTAVNNLGQALAGKPEGPVSLQAREVAGLLTQAIEALNETQSTLLPLTYKETVKKISEAAERLHREAKAVSVKPARD